MTRSRTLVLLAALALGTIHAPAPAWAVRCLDDAGDAAHVAAARSAIAGACACFGATSHAAHVRCAAGVINDRAAAALLRSECKSTVKKIAAQSTCGSDLTSAGANGPGVACVAKNTATGQVGCAMKALFACHSDDNGPQVRNACRAYTHCLDAADSDGDLRIAAPGDTGDCARVADAFTDNGDGTISDGRTGLTWEKLSDDGSIHDWDQTYGWGDAATTKIAALNASGFAGHTDWRVPTLDELFSILRVGTSPAVSAAFDSACAPGCTVLTCSCTHVGGHWTAAEQGAHNAWAVSFNSSGITSRSPKSFGQLVRAVRGGS